MNMQTPCACHLPEEVATSSSSTHRPTSKKTTVALPSLDHAATYFVKLCGRLTWIATAYGTRTLLGAVHLEIADLQSKSERLAPLAIYSLSSRAHNHNLLWPSGTWPFVHSLEEVAFSRTLAVYYQELTHDLLCWLQRLQVTFSETLPTSSSGIRH